MLDALYPYWRIVIGFQSVIMLHWINVKSGKFMEIHYIYWGSGALIWALLFVGATHMAWLKCCIPLRAAFVMRNTENSSLFSVF